MCRDPQLRPESRLTFHLKHLLPLLFVGLVCWGLVREGRSRQEVLLRGVEARAAVEQCETFRGGPELRVRYWVGTRAVTNWVKVSPKFAKTYRDGVPDDAEISIKHPEGKDGPVVVPKDTAYSNDWKYFIPVIFGLLIIIIYGFQMEQKRG
jgi:hypothetical protein